MRQAIYGIDVDGLDISTALNPILISLTVTLTDGGQADSLDIELDDTDGQIALPRVGARVTASLGWSDTGAAPVFEGVTDEPKSAGRHHFGRHGGHDDAGGSGAVGNVLSSGGRSKGRVLTLSAKSADMGGKLKQPQQAHKDKASFGDVAQAWGRAAGVDVAVAGALAAVQRPYWAIANESFLAWGTRIGREIGATFKVVGKHAIFLPRAGGTSASGQSLEGIRAVWGENLIDWSITPVQSRPGFAKLGARYYDPKVAAWQVEKADGPQAAADAAGSEHTARFKAASQDIAKNQAAANAAESAREKGAGDTVLIDGEPAAQPEAPCTVGGIRPGVDGGYTIAKVRHTLTRSGGFTSQLGLKQPSGGAGTDPR